MWRRRAYGPDEVRQTSRIYGWQKGRCGQDPDILDQTEDLLRLKGTRWPSSTVRAELVGDKVLDLLDEVMQVLGWAYRWERKNHETGEIKIWCGPIDPERPSTASLPDGLSKDHLVLDAHDRIAWALQNITLQHRSGEIERTNVDANPNS